MADAEFDEQADAIAQMVRDLDRDGALAPHERFAVACRGSANPAALAWLAENLALHREATVVDLGAGLGGPSQWLTARYGCTVVALEPALRASIASATLFPLLAITASSAALPIRADAFDASLLLGVVSVVDDAGLVVAEARRVSRRLGVLDYCSTTADDVLAGGSRFRSTDALERVVAGGGWTIDQTSEMALPAPKSWSDAVELIDVPSSPSEREVVAAIERGSIAPYLLVASR